MKILKTGRKYPYSEELEELFILLFGDCFYNVDKTLIYDPQDVIIEQ